MSADARDVRIRWSVDGKTAIVSIPDYVSSRDVFLQEHAAKRKTIQYEWNPGPDRNRPAAPGAR
jgi:hypothetical protein